VAAADIGAVPDQCRGPGGARAFGHEMFCCHEAGDHG